MGGCGRVRPHVIDDLAHDQVYAIYQQTQVQVCVAAIDDLFLIAAAMAALGALGALLLRSEAAPVGQASSIPPQQAATPATQVNRPVQDGGVAAASSDSARRELADVRRRS